MNWVAGSAHHHGESRGLTKPEGETQRRPHDAGSRFPVPSRLHVFPDNNSNRSKEGFMKILARLLCVALLSGCAGKAPEGSFALNANGVVVTPAAGDAKRVRLEVRSDRIVRVTAVADENLELPGSLMVVPANAAAPAFKVERKDGDL